MSLLLLLLAALIQVRGEALQGGMVSGSVELPLERAVGGDTPVLSLRTPRGGLKLLLDTGATSTMVTPELVRRLGLSSRELAATDFELAGGGSACGGLQPRRTRLPDLELGSPGNPGRLHLQGVEALVLPVAALPPGVDGVLGAPTLRRQPFWIDPQGARVAFGASALRLAGRSDGAAASSGPRPVERLRMRWRQGVPLLDLRTPIGIISGLADTGAEGLFISPELARQLPLQGRGQDLRLVGFCGEQPVEQTSLRGVGLAGEDKHPWTGSERLSPARIPVIITANPIFKVLGVEAIVGQELLRQRRQLWRLDLDPPVLVLN